MGYAGVGDVRQGKYFELDVDASSPEQAQTLASEVAHKLLANPVIERYTVEVGEWLAVGGTVAERYSASDWPMPAASPACSHAA